MTQEKVKAYTDIEQSRKLAEFLPIESADMCFNISVRKNMPPLMTPYSRFNEFFDISPTPDFLIPCWSLAALLDVLDRGALFKTPRGWICQAYAESKAITSNYHSNPIDSCYEMILELHKLKLL